MREENFTSNKPYLFRAIYEWLLDNNATPYLLVDTTKPNVDVPQEHIQNDQIVLNASPSAVRNWHVDNEAISFSARFAGVSRQIYVPMVALMAIYSQENGLGMAFPVQEESESEVDESVNQQPVKTENLESSSQEGAAEKLQGDKKVSHLKIVK